MANGSASSPARTFATDVTTSRTAREGFNVFRRDWEAQVGESWRPNELDAATTREFKVNIRSVSVHDVMIGDIYTASYVGRTTLADGGVLMHLIRHGSWRFGTPEERGEDVTVPAGGFIVRRDGPYALYNMAFGSMADILLLPAAVVAPLLGGRLVRGSTDSAEMRVLTAHTYTIREIAGDLTPAGLQAARDALLELVKGAIRRELDDVEPRLASALARAAMDIADQHLTDPDLTPAELARQLNVSVRTLHRAFSSTGETMAAYIRRNRLEQARIDLVAPPEQRLGVSEVAARYQFTDSSHFTRAFKAQYGQTPTRFARAPHEEVDPATDRARE
ncbi:helix-turn-helix domain-containing protein [Nocardia macrotermitis]|uniref:HTH-type transcriptional activator RhaS n=1 Tax=Nocardia macrotermitis TaxID=2585198 RepID=A0A7K0DA93_9NOCA|nr:helix-turn-helix domain-containing protein [Nocardia macrotermitis]MQY22471.1 HTH-type transcriptional activator RhaS [Nocardia macrotermitis]